MEILVVTSGSSWGDRSVGAGGPVGEGVVLDRLSDLATRRTDLERGLIEAEELIRADARELYEQLRPYEQKELMKLLIRSIEIGDEQMALEVYGPPPAEFGDDASRFESVSWLPGLVSQSVIRDVSRLPRAA